MEPGEELRVVKTRTGAHRPDSRSSSGYARDLWMDDEGNGVRGPSESRAPTPYELAEAAGQPCQFDYPPDTQRRESELPAWVDPIIDKAAEATVNGLIFFGRWGYAKWQAHRLSKRGQKAIPVTSEIEVQEEPPTASMTADEFRDHVLATIGLEQAAAHRRDLISRAVVVDPVYGSPQVVSDARLMLDGQDDELDDERRKAVAQWLTAGVDEAPLGALPKQPREAREDPRSLPAQA